jgi:signal transduction histidine kinase
MKLLEVEIGKFVDAIAASSPASVLSQVLTTLVVWKGLVDEIVESSESAVEVLNDLLNYDKIEVGTLKLEFAQLSLRDLVERTVAAMQVQARQKDIEIELRYLLAPSGDDPESVSSSARDMVLVGDVVRMRQVLRNLISNALKFTPAKGVVVVI